jgi:hypothetical protein
MGAFMAKRRTSSNRRSLAAWLMMLLPGFMFVGLLAPAAVHVKPKPQEETEPVSFRNFAPRRPIQFALPHAQSVVAPSAVEPMFAGARYVADQARRDPVPEPDVAAPAEPKDEIVLAEDNSAKYVAETIFETPIEGTGPQLVADLRPLWDPNLFDVIPELIDRTGFTMWDDFHGTSVRFGPPVSNVIPEPATGALLAIGLAALAIRRHA